jgi:hypothetical protein
MAQQNLHGRAAVAAIIPMVAALFSAITGEANLAPTYSQ